MIYRTMASPTMASSGDRPTGAPHIVFIPSAGMGHLLPFFRFSAALSTHGCDVSVMTVLPTVSAVEADHFVGFFAAFPGIRRIDFHLAPFDTSVFPDADPFFLRWEELRRSTHLLGALFANATPRISAVVTDITLASHVIPTAKELHLPCYILFISSAAMLSFLTYFPTYIDMKAGPITGDVDIPGLRRIPKASIPRPLHDRNHLFTVQFIKNGHSLTEADGILINTFHALEPEAITALQEGLVVNGFPPVFAMGPLKSLTPMAGGKGEPRASLAWLDKQPAQSVVYVGFGNRSAVNQDQIREIAIGLEASGCRFLWVIKSTVVDRDDDAELNELLGEGFLERVKGKGLVTKGWVDKEEVLKHPAIGLYLSHSGWNSVTEAAACGVPMLAWPRGGDHRVNAAVVVTSGLGVWMEQWSGDGEDGVVSGEEIGRNVKEMMEDEEVRKKAARVGEEAVKALAENGTSYWSMAEFVFKLKGKSL